MAAQGWLSEDDAEDALSAADNQGWISEEELIDDGDSSADLDASEQAGSWAEAIGLSDAEYASALPGFARDDGAPVATVHARSHSMARQHGFGGYEGLDSLHKGNGASLHSHSFGDTSPTPSRFRSPTITIQSLERVAAMQCDLEDRERKYRKTGRW